MNRKVIGIILIIFGIGSGGVGVTMMGGGISIPFFIIIGLGIYFIATSSKDNEKEKNKDEEVFGKKSFSQLYLGILILIFGIFNLFFKNSLVLVGIGTRLFFFKILSKPILVSSYSIYICLFSSVFLSNF